MPLFRFVWQNNFTSAGSDQNRKKYVTARNVPVKIPDFYEPFVQDAAGPQQTSESCGSHLPGVQHEGGEGDHHQLHRYRYQFLLQSVL
jgi:hypothetical protein